MTLKHKKIEKTMLCPGPLNYDDYHRFIGEKYNTSDIILGLVDKESKNLYSNHQWNINKIKEKKIYLDCLDGFSMSHTKQYWGEVLEFYKEIYFNAEAFLIFDRTFTKILGSNSEYLPQLLLRSAYCVNILKEHSIEKLIIMPYPHNAYFWLLYKAAKFLNIETFVVDASWSGGVRIFNESLVKTLKNDSTKITHDVSRIIHDAIQLTSSKVNLKDQKNYSLSTKFKKLKKYIRAKGIIKYSLSAILSFQRKRGYQKKFSELSSKHKFYDNSDEKKVVFFLHYQPESTTLPLSGVYNNQLAALYKIWANLPKEFSLYVKEHPTQYYGPQPINNNYRNGDFLDFIADLPNCYLLGPRVSIEDVFRHADCLATLTGSVILQAISSGKKIICFSDYIGNSSLILNASGGIDPSVVEEFLYQKVPSRREIEMLVQSLLEEVYLEDDLTYDIQFEPSAAPSAWIKSIEKCLF
jgi:hypothetical protein